MEQKLESEETAELRRLVSTKPTNSLYRPLSRSKESIRLLSLSRPTSPIGKDGLMDFKLEHFDLSNCPQLGIVVYLGQSVANQRHQAERQFVHRRREPEFCTAVHFQEFRACNAGRQ